MKNTGKLILSIDVEGWAQSTLSRDMPITDRAGSNFSYLLDILAETDHKATCFVLGLFADKFPDLVKRIVAEGHELASHGCGHDHVFKLSPEDFRKDIQRSRKQLEDLSGIEIKGYRAPFFSITDESLWALEILAEEGFVYDSSIYPVKNRNYGIPDWPRQPVKLNFKNKSLVEMPIATYNIMGKSFPVAGGGYHRLLPWSIISSTVKKNIQKGETFVYYCHPYEFDPNEFKNLKFKLPWKTKLHQGLGRKGFEKKLSKLLKSFDSEIIIDNIESNTSEFPHFVPKS